MSMRENIAQALYEHWAVEDFANEYCSWDQLPDKQTWLARADAVLAVPDVAEARSLLAHRHTKVGYELQG